MEAVVSRVGRFIWDGARHDDPSAGTNRDDPPHAVSLKEEQPSDSSAELYAVYEEHSKTLRTWLVAYGIGAPVLFITNDKVWKAIASSGSAEEV